MSQKPKTNDEMRKLIGEFLKEGGEEAHQFWDLITCLRGPDSPSERADMNSAESAAAYKGRRERKAKTVEVIRALAFYGASSGGARLRFDRNYVTLPPQSKWDHFDKHVARAAASLNIEVKYEE